MSQPCTVDKCIRASRGLCDCCHQQLCLQHLNEHNASLLNQLNPLTDEINTLSDRLNVFNIEHFVGESRRKLEVWRNKCYQQIDCFFEQKCQQLDRIVNIKVQKQRVEVNRLQSKLGELIREQETTRQDIDSLTTTVNRLKQQMDDVEQTSLRVTTGRLVLDDGLISIEDTNEHELDLSNLSAPCKTITYPAGSKLVICANDDYLLMHRKPNLCLVDRKMNVVKEAPWNYEKIFDMCWCSTLNRFIVNEGKSIFLVDERTLTIGKVQAIEERNCISCTTSESCLFLSTDTFGSSVMKYNLLPSIKLVTQWNSPHTCGNDEVIYNMKENNEKLALLIKNKSEKSLRMELRSADTLDRIWSLQFDTVYEENVVFYFCSISCSEWLAADHEMKRLLQITKDGKLKAVIPYENVPWVATIFGNRLAVSRSGGINFHKLS